MVYYFYFDASALVKRYTQELGSDKVNFLPRHNPPGTVSKNYNVTGIREEINHDTEAALFV